MTYSSNKDEASGLSAAATNHKDGPFGWYRILRRPNEFSQFSGSIEEVLEHILSIGTQLGQMDIGTQSTAFHPDVLTRYVNLASYQHTASVLLEDYGQRLAHYNRMREIARRDIPLPEITHIHAKAQLYGTIGKAILLGNTGAFVLTIPGEREKPIIGKRPILRINYFPAIDDGSERLTFTVESASGQSVFFSAFDFYENGSTDFFATNGFGETPRETRLGTFDNEGKRIS